MITAYKKTLDAKEERITELEKRLEEHEAVNNKLSEELATAKKLSKLQRMSTSPMGSPKVPRDQRYSLKYVTCFGSTQTLPTHAHTRMHARACTHTHARAFTSSPHASSLDYTHLPSHFFLLTLSPPHTPFSHNYLLHSHPHTLPSHSLLTHSPYSILSIIYFAYSHTPDSAHPAVWENLHFNLCRLWDRLSLGN